MPCSSVDLALYFPLSNSFCMLRSSPKRASCIRSDSIGSFGGLDSRSLSSTLSSIFVGEVGALPESLRPGELSREGMSVEIVAVAVERCYGGGRGMEDMFVSLICRRQKDRSGVLHDGILQLVVPAAACATEPRVISAFTNVAALPRQVILRPRYMC